MNDTTPTVMIKGENGEPLRINVEDYDKEKHELLAHQDTAAAAAKAGASTSTKEENETDDFDREAAKARLKEAGVDFNTRAKNETLQQLIAELDAKEAAGAGTDEKVFNVEAKDDKFIIVDGEGAQVGEDVFETEEDANAMVSLLKGE